VSGHRRWSGIALAASFVLTSIGLAAVAPTVQAATITLSGITCGTSATFEVPTFVAKADNLVITASDSSCQGFDRPSGNFNFTGSSGSLTSTSPFGSLTFTSRKQQSALNTPLVELRKSGSSVVITVVNNSSARATTNFTAKTPPNGQVAVSYDYTFQVDGSPVEFTRSSGTLPPGLSLDLNGRLQGTPTAAGSYTFNVKAYNLSTEEDTLSGNVTVVIDPAASAVWTQRTPPNGVAGSVFSPYTFIASGGTESYSVTGALPTGMTLSSAGVLSGTPTQTGTFSFVVSKDGVAENSGSVSVTIGTPAIDKITICHRTRATTNPYVLITVSVNSVIGSGGNGHSHHDTTRTNKTNPIDDTTNGSGPFVPSFSYPANQKWWGDIIPPFNYVDGGATESFDGLNWGPDWTMPNPASGADRTRDNWLEPSEFAASVSGTNDKYRQAVALCMDLGASGTQSSKSAEIDTPDKYFKVAIDNGEDPESVREDLVEQEAIDGSGSTPRTIPGLANLETTFNSTSKVTTDAASGITETTANLNGTLKSGNTWTTWKYEWSTRTSDIVGDTGSSSSYNAGTDPASSIGAGATTPVRAITGLTCNTTYYFRIVGTDTTPSTNYGLIRSFRTDNCGNNGGGGGGNNGGGNGNSGNGGSGGSTNATPTTNTTPAPNRNLGNGRPTRVTLPPAATSNNPSSPTLGQPGTTGGTNNTGSQTPGTSSTPERSGPQTVNPVASVPPPPGDAWVPEEVRLEDPRTGEPTPRVVDNQGTWVVNPRSGTVSFTPAPNFVGTAVLNVKLTARSGLIQIQPIRIRVSAASRILVIKGGVPSDILGGILRWR
jgi:CshA-type fibril repeat protein